MTKKSAVAAVLAPTPPKPSFEIQVPVIYKPGQQPGSINLSLTALELGYFFGKMTDQEIIDAIPLADKYLKGLEKWIKAAKEVVKSRFEAPETIGESYIYRGTLYQAVYAKMERTDIDRDKVRAKYGEKGYAALCTTSSYYQISFKPVTSEAVLSDTPEEE